MNARWVTVALLACLLVTCGGEDDPQAVLDTNRPTSGDDGGGGGGDDGDDCRVVDGNPMDRLSLISVKGPIDEVEEDSVFHITGQYYLQEDDVDVYVIGTICNTSCEETKVTPPIAPGNGTYYSDFRVVSLIDPEASKNCLVVTMIAMDQRVLVSCEYHF